MTGRNKEASFKMLGIGLFGSGGVLPEIIKTKFPDNA
jgi:hypothetical protein